MASDKPIWLLTNSRSGSNSERSIKVLEGSFRESGFVIERRIAFPDEELPTAQDLDSAAVPMLAVFTGDGTLNAAITRLGGWDGQVLVLPGGTMNLLSRRLHGPDATPELIIDRISSGAYRSVRPATAHCEKGVALAGLLAGPGCRWASVREAMRDFDLPAMAEGAGDAIAETTGSTMVRVASPALGRENGYPLIEFTPSHRGMQLDAFHAEGTGEILQQSWALLRRNFRDGPHTRLGLVDEVTLETCDGKPLDILIDGEATTLPAKATFTVAPCEVDLLATHHGY